MARKQKPKGTAQKDTPVGERVAGDEIAPAHEAAVLDNLSGTMLSGFARLYEIESDMDAALVRHIEPLRQDRRDAWKALKSDCGDMERIDIENQYRLYKRVRDLEDFEDAEHAARVKDNIRRIWQATKLGETMNFLDSMETVRPGNGEAPVSARREGYRDFGLGMQFDQCPYQDAVNREAWQTGWHAARDTFEKDAPTSAPKEPPSDSPTVQ